MKYRDNFFSNSTSFLFQASLLHQGTVNSSVALDLEHYIMGIYICKSVGTDLQCDLPKSHISPCLAFFNDFSNIRNKTQTLTNGIHSASALPFLWSSPFLSPGTIPTGLRHFLDSLGWFPAAACGPPEPAPPAVESGILFPQICLRLASPTQAGTPSAFICLKGPSLTSPSLFSFPLSPPPTNTFILFLELIIT